MPTVLDNIRTASPVSEGHLIKASDWGVLAPGGTGTAFSSSKLTNNGSGGSLANSTGAFQITFVTANGETAASVEATVSVTGGGSGSVTVSISGLTGNGGTQANAATILGWNVYSGSGSGNEQRNVTSAGLNNQALSTVVLPNGTSLTYIPIATTSVQVNVYGTGAVPPTANLSGIQQPLPQIAANSSADVFLTVKRTFQVQKEVNWIRPASSADAAGLAPALMDCVAPLWASGTSFSAGAFILVNRTVFIATVGGTSAGSIPAGLTTRPAKYTTVTDNGVTWMSLGEASIVRARFVNMTGSAGAPIAQEYDLFQA